MSDQSLQSAIERVEIVEQEASQTKRPLDAFVDHQKRALEETGKAIEALLPDGFKSHSKEAGKEFAKGLKVLVDAAVGEIEKASREIDKQMRQRQQPNTTTVTDASDDRPSSTGAQKVKVQVD